MHSKLQSLTRFSGIYDFLKKEASLLPKKNQNIILCDFDNTIFSREEQLKQSEPLRKNRGDDGTEVITNLIGIENYIQKYFENKSFPKDIIDLMDPEKDIFLTAGIYELQIAKIRSLGLSHFQAIVTPNAQDKILCAIRYVLYDLKYIPRSLTIYEDRVEYFVEYKDLIEDILGTHLIIQQVVMNGNTGYIEIKEIK